MLEYSLVSTMLFPFIFAATNKRGVGKHWKPQGETTLLNRYREKQKLVQLKLFCLFGFNSLPFTWSLTAC